MQVNNTPNETVRIEAAQSGTQNGANQTAPASPTPAADVYRADAVNISSGGFALTGAGELADNAEVSRLDPQRIDELRSKIVSGAYNSLEMADHVARSMMRSGDL